MKRSALSSSLMAMIVLASASEIAFGEYFSHLPADSGKVGRIPKPGENDAYKPVGWMEFVGGSCTATLITSNIFRDATRPADPWVLTAGHCVQDNTDGTVKFHPLGRYANTNGNPADFEVLPEIGSDIVRKHPRNSSTLQRPDANFDVGVFRLNPANAEQRAAIAAAGSYELRRTEIVNNEGVFAVGVGQANAIGGFTGTTGDKRWFNSNVETVRAGTIYRMGLGQGTAEDPKRYVCPGDSGGPSLSVNGGRTTIVGVHSAGLRLGADCAGNQVSQVDANLTDGRLYNLADSYSRRSVFRENLRIGGTLSDSFESEGDGYGNTFPAGVMRFGDVNAAGWSSVTVNHPRFGEVSSSEPSEDSFRYVSAIGKDDGGNAELYKKLDAGNTLDDESLGAVMQRTRASVIAKDFEDVVVPASGQITIEIDRRFNSLFLGDDLGVSVGGGAITWAGYLLSSRDRIDAWVNRSVTLANLTPGNTTLRIYLLSVPEPGTALLMLSGVVLRGARRRRRLR